MTADPYTYDEDDSPPFELVDVEPAESPTLPEALRPKLLIHTVHDGDVLPRHYRFDEQGTPIVDPEELEQRYIEERDWGANLVARELSKQLGLKHFARCRIARVLMDFNRFPGSTPPSIDDALERLAIHTPFTTALDHEQKMSLLSNYYDRISDLMETQSLVGKLMMIGVHTYDEHNPSQTQRPDLSLLYQAAGYQKESRMPYGVFDPIYPDVLGESTCSRILRDRISLNLERSGFRVSHNHPYPLPEGSMEVRAQVWYFFFFLRQAFEREFPETRTDMHFERVWQMLLNTNLRLARGEALRSYLHRYRKVPEREHQTYRMAEKAYARVRQFLENSNVVSEYQNSSDRPSSFAIEVRKDLICEFDSRTGRPLPLSGSSAKRIKLIARVIAEAIATHFDTDRSFM